MQKKNVSTDMGKKTRQKINVQKKNAGERDRLGKEKKKENGSRK